MPYRVSGLRRPASRTGCCIVSLAPRREPPVSRPPEGRARTGPLTRVHSSPVRHGQGAEKWGQAAAGPGEGMVSSGSASPFGSASMIVPGGRSAGSGAPLGLKLGVGHSANDLASSGHARAHYHRREPCVMVWRRSNGRFLGLVEARFHECQIRVRLPFLASKPAKPPAHFVKQHFGLGALWSR